jgi:hypothetical protein
MSACFVKPGSIKYCCSFKTHTCSNVDIVYEGRVLVLSLKLIIIRVQKTWKTSELHFFILYFRFSVATS